MASTVSIISTVLFTTGVVFVLQGAGLILLLVTRWRRRQTDTLGTDHANMLILFQSMRDLLAEQKQLARQLNADIDRKLTRINLVVHDALDSARRPAAAARNTSHPSGPDPRDAFLAAARRAAGSIEPKEADRAPTQESSQKPAPPAATIGGEMTAPPAGQPASTADGSIQEPVEGFRALADDDAPEAPTGERFNAWVGLDFADEGASPYRVDVPETVPASPEDADKARAAFRSLLDLTQEAREGREAGQPAAGSDSREAGPEPLQQAKGSPLPAGQPVRLPPERGGTANGARKLTPLQKRVHEYSDAGMSVPQIARELGIGKGEVRLILSLREGRGAGR